MFFLTNSCWFPQKKSLGKSEALCKFIEGNLDRKIIDMCSTELHSILAVECMKLDKEFPKCRKYNVSVFKQANDERLFRASITRGEHQIPVVYLVFLHIDPNYDYVTPIEVNYTASTT